MIPYSVLDLSPVPEGITTAGALANSLDLARRAEAAGYNRFWLAEHHNMPGIASAATAVVVGHVAAGTRTIRVGAGGIMLPNHAPLMVAEAFGTLAELYPGRIDLGIGRAPGSDQPTMRALRRGLEGGDNFPEDVAELLGYFRKESPASGVRAIPGQGTDVPVWVLGSSLYGAQLAAHFGLPYAFAAHFAPGELGRAIEVYRRSFRPSEGLEAPRFMLAINVFAGQDDAEGRFLRSSMEQAFANLRSGRPGKLPRPVEDVRAMVDPSMFQMVTNMLSCSATGGPETVRRELAALIARYQPDEVILTGQIHDHGARVRSFEIAAEAMRQLGEIHDPEQGVTRVRHHATS